jgi:hypothetical protein
MALAAVDAKATLISPEGELSGSHLHPHTIHRFDKPTAADGHDPLGYGIFVPSVLLARNQVQKHDGGRSFTARGAPNLRNVLNKRREVEIVEPLLFLMADTSPIPPNMPNMETGLGLWCHRL